MYLPRRNRSPAALTSDGNIQANDMTDNILELDQWLWPIIYGRQVFIDTPKLDVQRRTIRRFSALASHPKLFQKYQ